MAYTFDSDTGMILEAEFIASPNFDARPAGAEINLLVIHGISLPPAQFGGRGIIQCFTNTLNPFENPAYESIKDLKVSSHLLIRRDGALLQFVSFKDRAWHAGESQFQGRKSCNNFSIGIELEGTDELPYEDAQYNTLISVTQLLLRVYPEMTPDRIVGHCDIAPGRKTDPGPSFDWQRLRCGIE